MAENSFKMKLTKKRIILTISVLVLAAASLYFLYYYNTHWKPVTVLNYNGVVIGFRQDIREAAKVPLYTDANSTNPDAYLRIGIIHPLVTNITIVFKNVNLTENPYYTLEGAEIVGKLKLAYSNVRPPVNLNFTAKEVSSYDNLPGKIQNPIIALIHPAYANETSVRFDAREHVVYIQGKTHKDFDLATIRFLMAALNIQAQT
ncbi:MAG: hypothetical protein J4452_02350 [Candidatus Aenigmarchaeota archaeon]|nr:hypothetical protein [Candidatus Aenigmarchaeota archaeon]